MSKFLDSVMQQAHVDPDAYAFRNTAGQSITYGELARQSDNLAVYIREHNPGCNPVALYGHKDPKMVVGMFGCMKAGCAYVPIDTLFPPARMEVVLGQLDDVIVLCTVAAPEGLERAGELVAPDELRAICEDGNAVPKASWAICGDDHQYILFTSGSTGTPKGVIQRAETIDIFAENFAKFMPEGKHQVHFSRAPFTFDSSLFDIATALPHGHCMFHLEESTEGSLAKTFAALGESGLTVWHSTPAFLEMCLVDPSFNKELLPNVHDFVMCGEVLHHRTCTDVWERFGSEACMWNGYGATETQMMSDVLITPEIVETCKTLPIGYAWPGTCEFQIVDRETREELPQGQPGEICILGETVGAGYYKLPERTASVFGQRADHAGKMRAAYYTGDEGWLDETGLLYFIGRFDTQVKINGYRIEIGEIENTLNAYDEVAISCVLPVQRNGHAVALTAYVVLNEGFEESRELSKDLKSRLKETLPEYMVPRSFKYRDSLPTNMNEKFDRKELTRLEAEGAL